MPANCMTRGCLSLRSRRTSRPGIHDYRSEMNALDRGNGPAILLIHAFPLNRTMWAHQIASLTSHFRLIAPDIRGFGESQPPSPWTMDEMAGDLHSLLDSLGIQTCAVAGVSMGG